MQKKIDVLRNALKNLGIKSGTKVRVETIDHMRSKVFVNGKYFGVFDYVKNTFVD